MANIKTSVTQLIGNTPLVELVNLEKEYGLKARLCAKLEYFNATGSAKDRVGAGMIADAQARGVLKAGGTIIEPTSGNTGIGLAAVGASKGYRVIIVMPDNFSLERRKLMKAYGAELVLSEGAKGMAGAIAKAQELAQEIPGSWIAGQFDNPANWQSHYATTGPEIWQDSEGQVDVFVAGVGTGGTITGTGRYLKEKNPELQVVAVEPATSAVLSGGQAGPHDLQGIGAGFIPKVLDTTVYDRIMPITNQQAYYYAREICRREGYFVGITSGAALCAAIALAKEETNTGKTIVALLPDSGDRYLSSALFEEETV